MSNFGRWYHVDDHKVPGKTYFAQDDRDGGQLIQVEYGDGNPMNAGDPNRAHYRRTKVNATWSYETRSEVKEP